MRNTLLYYALRAMKILLFLFHLWIICIEQRAVSYTESNFLHWIGLDVADVKGEMNHSNMLMCYTNFKIKILILL